MRTFPYPGIGSPDVSSPARYLLWLARGQKATLAVAVVFGSVWMLAQASVPYALGEAVDGGIVAGDFAVLVSWVGILVALTVLQSASAAMRHRASVSNWLQASLRSAQLIGDKVSRTGGALPRRVPFPFPAGSRRAGGVRHRLGRRASRSPPGALRGGDA